MSITTDQQKIVLTWKVFIPLLISALIVSNTATGFIFKIEQNEVNQVYERQRTDRKLKAQAEEFKQLLYIAELESEVERLKRLNQ